MTAPWPEAAKRSNSAQLSGQTWIEWISSCGERCGTRRRSTKLRALFRKTRRATRRTSWASASGPSAWVTLCSTFRRYVFNSR